jgi:hypothetical protein
VSVREEREPKAGGGGDEGKPALLPHGILPGGTANQVDRQRRLDGVSPTLARLYARAVELLETHQHLGDMALLAHCVREILNRLPDALGATIGSHQGDASRATAALATAWAAEGLSSASDGGEAPGAPDRLVTVPATVFDCARDVVRQQEVGATAARRRSAYLLGGGSAAADLAEPDPNSAASVDVVIKVRGFFMAYVHAADTGRDPPPVTQTKDHFRQFEEIVDISLQGWWDAQGEVEDILAEANLQTVGNTEDSADPPTAVHTGDGE